ncbi:S-type pyocin domain-containing protein [Streptomyces sp. NPDC014656]|uniref:S-type pyocin domain-containing protein n=1 Tax=Streptomyces sp. NPDC014656 TaxID=3364878 RepID=UPI0036FB6EED
MRAEETRDPDNVLAFRRTRGDDAPGRAPRAAPVAGPETASPPVTVLSAERGIINTGIVHGGQHVTTVEFSGRTDGGTDGDR